MIFVVVKMKGQFPLNFFNMSPSFDGKFLDAHYIVFTLLTRIFFVKSMCDTKKNHFGSGSVFHRIFWILFSGFSRNFSVLLWQNKTIGSFLETNFVLSRWQSDTQLNSLLGAVSVAER